LSSSGSKKIALLLPETKTTRYEAQDRPLFEAKVKQLCPDCEIIYSNADQKADQQQNQADAALTNGAKVMVLDPVDSASAASIVAKAKAQIRQRRGRQAQGPVAGRQAQGGGPRMNQAITALGKNGFVGVYAANDGTAGGATAAMKGAGISRPAGQPPAGRRVGRRPGQRQPGRGERARQADHKAADICSGPAATACRQLGLAQ
jgi:ABC-type xylose transport system substrate-binding protein